MLKELITDPLQLASMVSFVFGISLQIPNDVHSWIGRSRKVLAFRSWDEARTKNDSAIAGLMI